MQHRSWFPTVLIGSTLLLIVAFAIATKHGEQAYVAPEPAVEHAEPVTEEGYKTAVMQILHVYKEDSDEARAYDALVLVRVPPEYMQMHLDLVVALGKVRSKETTDGQARLNALQAQYPWLPL